MRPRVPILHLLHGIAVVAFPIAVLASILNGHPLLGLGYALDTGLMPSVTVLLALSPVAIRRGRSLPFLMGFVAAGWAAVVPYVATCVRFPDVMVVPILSYINEVEPGFMEADTLGLYSASLVIQGLILAVPQFLVALAGGLLAKWVAPRRLGIAGVGGKDHGGM